MNMMIVIAFVFLVSLSGSCADNGFFWHVTDFHYDHTYWTSQLSCNAEVTNPGPFGDYWCDSPWALVNDVVQNMATIKSDVDFVIWTGDTVAHIKDANLSLATNMDILKNATLLFNKTFPSTVAFFPTLGNHDFYPSDQADIVQDEMYNETSEIWKQWIDDPNQLSQFMSGGFYHKQINPKVSILSLNTNLYFTSNKITKGLLDPAGQFQWMKDALEQVRAKGTKVIVIAHIPPGMKTPDVVNWFYPDHQETFVGILTNYSDVIVASDYGHDHSDGFKITEDAMNASKAIPAFIAPSVTPWRFKIPNKTGLPHNPGVRLIEYDRETGRHINYIQYFINLTETNNNDNSSWKELYNFNTAYGVSDMSVESLRNIFSRMEKDDGKKLAQKYCNYAVVSTYDQYCPDKYRWEIVCGGHIYDEEKTQKCVHKLEAGSGMILNAYLVLYILISVSVCLINF